MKNCKAQLGKLLIFVGLSLMTGFIWGQVLAPAVPHPDLAQHYTDPQIPIRQFDEMASVDVIRNGDDIWVVEHYSGHLIFEYNRFKEQDKEAFGEYEGVLGEVKDN